MESSSEGRNRKIVKNTLMLYIRMFFIMFVSLYTSRIILEALGIDDYGIYNVVGGLVTAFSLLTSSLSSIGARFINFHLGKNNIDRVKDVVSNTINIQIYLSLIVFVVSETLGLWFLNNKLLIPESRLVAANWVYQLSVITFIIKLLSVPYNSLIIAHEKMSIFAYLAILEVVLQLGLVYLLLVLHTDRLIFYAAFMLFLAAIVTLIYFLYCRRNFEECCYRTHIDIGLFKEMSSFAGWNFIGTASGVFRNQGVDIIINLFFGITINAARGIAAQINNAVMKFAQNFMTALNPQITQTYAAEDWSRLHALVVNGVLMSYYLLWIICVPIYFEMDLVLRIWLEEVPPMSSSFSKLQIIISLIAVLSSTNITAMLATGNIKKYQIIVGTISLLNFPLSFAVLKLGYSASSTYLVAIFVEVVCLFARLIISRSLLKSSITEFCKRVIIRVLLVSTVSVIVPILIIHLMPENILRLVVVSVGSMLWSMFVIYFLGVDSGQRNKIKSFISAKFKIA